MTKETKNMHEQPTKLEEMDKFVRYKFNYWTEAFNKILYNLLFKSIVKQQQAQFADVVNKIEKVA